jgi:hypothetical protein
MEKQSSEIIKTDKKSSKDGLKLVVGIVVVIAVLVAIKMLLSSMGII